MITVLLLEDDVNKRDRITNILRDQHIPQELIVSVNNVFDAEVALSETIFDLLILDINVPLRQGTEPSKKGGETLLKDINARRKNIIVPAHILGLTAYPEIKDEVNATFENLTWTVLHFDRASNGWEQKLVEKVSHIYAYKKAEFEQDQKANKFKYDVAIVTALESELLAVRNLPYEWSRVEDSEADDTIYHHASIKIKDRTIRIICAAATQMGMPHSAVLASKMIHEHRPRYLWMLGICAGIKNKSQFGDIVVADSCWDYGNGKFTEDEKTKELIFEQAPVQYPLDARMRSLVSLATMNIELREKIRSGYKTPPAHELSIYLGPMASGAAVIASEEYLQHPKSQHRKLCGIEMEAYGVMCAGMHSTKPRPTVTIAKSVCDFGDSAKNDEAQSYAAYTSASFFDHFARLYLFA